MKSILILILFTLSLSTISINVAYGQGAPQFGANCSQLVEVCEGSPTVCKTEVEVIALIDPNTNLRFIYNDAATAVEKGQQECDNAGYDFHGIVALLVK